MTPTGPIGPNQRRPGRTSADRAGRTANRAVRPVEVMAWLAPRTHRASGVTMREAVRHLPTADGERLMAAYREKRPAG